MNHRPEFALVPVLDKQARTIKRREMMTTYSIGTNRFTTMSNARQAVEKMNAEDPKAEIIIEKDGKTAEIWVGPVTFMPAGKDAYIAYSKADIDSIGAVRWTGTVFTAGSRGSDLGAFLSLFEAAHALHDHAKSGRYTHA